MNRDNSDNGRKQERLARRRERERQATENRLARRDTGHTGVKVFIEEVKGFWHFTVITIIVETAQARQAQMDANRVTQQLRRDTEMQTGNCFQPNQQSFR